MPDTRFDRVWVRIRASWTAAWKVNAMVKVERDATTYILDPSEHSRRCDNGVTALAVVHSHLDHACQRSMPKYEGRHSQCSDLIVRDSSDKVPGETCDA